MSLSNHEVHEVHLTPACRKEDSEDDLGWWSWFDICSLVCNLHFYGFLTAVGVVYLDPTFVFRDDSRGCSTPLPSFLLTTGAANVVFVSVRFLAKHRGNILQLLGTLGVLGFGSFSLVSQDLFQTPFNAHHSVAGHDGYCNPVVYHLAVVAVAALALQLVLLSISLFSA